MSTEPQPGGVRFPAGERRGGGAEARFLTVRAQKCLGPWFTAAGLRTGRGPLRPGRGNPEGRSLGAGPPHGPRENHDDCLF